MAKFSNFHDKKKNFCFQESLFIHKNDTWTWKHITFSIHDHKWQPKKLGIFKTWTGYNKIDFLQFPSINILPLKHIILKMQFVFTKLQNLNLKAKTFIFFEISLIFSQAFSTLFPRQNSKDSYIFFIIIKNW